MFRFPLPTVLAIILLAAFAGFVLPSLAHGAEPTEQQAITVCRKGQCVQILVAQAGQFVQGQEFVAAKQTPESANAGCTCGAACTCTRCRCHAPAKALVGAIEKRRPHVIERLVGRLRCCHRRCH